MSKKVYSNDLIRFHSLMNINESEGYKETPISQHRLFKNTVKLSPNGRVYGVVQEGNKYFIKTSLLEEGKKLDATDFSYLGGLQNPLKGRYNSYNDAVKRLNENIISEQNMYGDVDKKSKMLFESYIKEADDETVVDGEPEPEMETEPTPEPEPEPSPEPTPEVEPEVETEPEPEVEPEMTDDAEAEIETEPSPEGETDMGDEVELNDNEKVELSDDEEVETDGTEVAPEGDMGSEEETGNEEDDIKALAGKFVAEIQRPDIEDSEKIESVNQMIGNLFGYLKKNQTVKSAVVAKMQEKIEELNSGSEEVVESKFYKVNEAKKKKLKGDVLKMVNEASKYNPKIKTLLEKLEKTRSKKLIKENKVNTRKTSK